MLDQRVQAVAVRRHEHARVREKVRHDRVIPVGEHPLDDVLQAFGARQHLGRQVRVAAVVNGMPLVRRLHGPRPHLVAPPPSLYLPPSPPPPPLPLSPSLPPPPTPPL